MPDSYKQLIKSNPDETEIRSFLVDGDQVSVTLRIPDTRSEANLLTTAWSTCSKTGVISEN